MEGGWLLCSFLYPSGAFTECVKQVDSDIQPLLSNIIQHHSTLTPRVLLSYSILYWFALQVYQINIISLTKYRFLRKVECL